MLGSGSSTAGTHGASRTACTSKTGVLVIMGMRRSCPHEDRLRTALRELEAEGEFILHDLDPYEIGDPIGVAALMASPELPFGIWSPAST